MELDGWRLERNRERNVRDNRTKEKEEDEDDEKKGTKSDSVQHFYTS